MPCDASWLAWCRRWRGFMDDTTPQGDTPEETTGLPGADAAPTSPEQPQPPAEGTAPQAPGLPATEESQASATLGADAPLDGNVVRAEFGKGRATAGGGQGKRAGKSASAPRPPRKGANAPDEGVGGGPSDETDDGGGAEPSLSAKPGKKKERTVDWGKYNMLHANFWLIYGTDTVWDASERMIMKISNMGHAHGADMVRMWKASEDRKTVMQDRVLFDPTMKCNPTSTVNLFDGFKTVPKEGDVTPILQLIRFLTSKTHDNEIEADAIMHWLLCWLAYPLQNPGAKLRTAIIMHGDEGAGKNMLFDTMVAIYGKYGAVVGQDELEDKFNDWRSCKLFVVGDEVSSRAELVHNKNRLKSLISSGTVQINPKNLPRREERNHMNIVFLSNELQPLALDNSDRRYLVVYTPRAREREFYLALGKWLEEGGVAAFYHFLLNYRISEFDPSAPAPWTQAKQNLIDLNRKSPEEFWAQWSGNELDLPYHACSQEQMYKAYLRWCVRTGERYPFKQLHFTPTLMRYAEAQGEYVKIKPFGVVQDDARRKTTKMFLVTEPTPAAGQSEGDWATDCVQSFEKLLRKYMGYGVGAPAPGSSQSQDGGDE